MTGNREASEDWDLEIEEELAAGNVFNDVQDERFLEEIDHLEQAFFFDVEEQTIDRPKRRLGNGEHTRNMNTR